MRDFKTMPVKGSELQSGDRILSRHPEGEVGVIEVFKHPGQEKVIVALWEPPLGGIAGDTMLNPEQEFQRICDGDGTTT